MLWFYRVLKIKGIVCHQPNSKMVQTKIISLSKKMIEILVDINRKCNLLIFRQIRFLKAVIFLAFTTDKYFLFLHAIKMISYEDLDFHCMKWYYLLCFDNFFFYIILANLQFLDPKWIKYCVILLLPWTKRSLIFIHKWTSSIVSCHGHCLAIESHYCTEEHQLDHFFELSS